MPKAVKTEKIQQKKDTLCLTALDINVKINFSRLYLNLFEMFYNKLKCFHYFFLPLR